MRPAFPPEPRGARDEWTAGPREAPGRRRFVGGLAPLLAAALFASGSATAAPVPPSVSFQGALSTSGGVPANGTYDLVLRLFTAETGGSQVYSQTLGSVQVSGGLLDATVGPLTSALLSAHAELWVELAVLGEPPLPRQRLRSAPYAIQSETANTAATAAALSCSGCVSSSHIAANVTLAGTVGVGGTVQSCADGAPGCGLKVGSTAALVDPKDGKINLQVTGGLRLRTADNGAWASMEAGAVTAHGPLVADAGSTLTAPVVVNPDGVVQAGAATVKVGRDTGEVNILAVGASTGGAVVSLEPGSGGRRWSVVSHGAGDAGAEAGSFAVRDESTGKRPVIVRPDGRVGVGTGAAEAPLQVVSDANNAVSGTNATIRVDNYRAQHNPMAVYQHQPDWYAGRLVTDGFGLSITQASGATKSAAVALLAVDTDGQSGGNVVRVQADGNVGIGATAPAEKLHVAGNIKADGLVHASTGVYVAGTQVVDPSGMVVGPVDPATHQHDFSSQGDAAKLIASAMCAVLHGGGHTTACPRICSNTGADCNEICAAAGGGAINAIHVYGGYVQRTYLYNGTSGRYCGPNYCCCAIGYNNCPTPF